MSGRPAPTCELCGSSVGVERRGRLLCTDAERCLVRAHIRFGQAATQRGVR